MDEALKSIIKDNQHIIYDSLNKLIPDDNEILTKAIRYSLLSNGKRLRPLLIIETAKLFTEDNLDDVIIVASAMEMIHIFSLIHDDLPSMDNDDYRRGELTCHKKFTEYEAILAGDSLIPLAFEIILTKTNLSYEDKCKIILIISKAIGYKGMCLGQSLDLEIGKNNKTKSIEKAELINTYKTGCLFKACVEIGCILGKANKHNTELLIDYSLNFGKAFQLMDDLDDNEIEKIHIEETKNKVNQLVDICINDLSKLQIQNTNSLDVLKLIARFCLR